jgi:hypothetical protein
MEMKMSDEQGQEREALQDVDTDCIGLPEEAVDAEETWAPELEALLSADEEAVQAALAALGCRDFAQRGGGWGGSSRTVEKCIAIGRRNGLQVTSRKRNSGNTASDHHVSQRASDAADISNGRSPAPEMDRTAQQIAAALGHRGWRSGYLVERCNGLRIQLIWRAPDHYNHVHVGVRRL